VKERSFHQVMGMIWMGDPGDELISIRKRVEWHGFNLGGGLLPSAHGANSECQTGIDGSVEEGADAASSRGRIYWLQEIVFDVRRAQSTLAEGTSLLRGLSLAPLVFAFCLLFILPLSPLTMLFRLTRLHLGMGSGLDLLSDLLRRHEKGLDEFAFASDCVPTELERLSCVQYFRE
jgi:hypothetical protein